MKTGKEIVLSDLKYIVGSLEEEMLELSGKNVLITGGAGFLGCSFHAR